MSPFLWTVSTEGGPRGNFPVHRNRSVLWHVRLTEKLTSRIAFSPGANMLTLLLSSCLTLNVTEAVQLPFSFHIPSSWVTVTPSWGPSKSYMLKILEPCKNLLGIMVQSMSNGKWALFLLFIAKKWCTTIKNVFEFYTKPLTIIHLCLFQCTQKAIMSPSSKLFPICKGLL